jgi:AcrR family transcriptional regulator
MMPMQVPTRPYRSVVRSKAAEQTRERIVAAAANLLRSVAPARFSLDAVAKEAGVTRLTIYNQFGSRRTLLEAVFDDRAARGGLHRLREALSEDDPQRGLRRLIEIFCDFWGSDPKAIESLHQASSGDTEFEASLKARNERRREAISVLAARMVERGEIAADAVTDLTDLLFVLTSFPVFSELTARGRTKVGACALIQAAAGDALLRASSP